MAPQETERQEGTGPGPAGGASHKELVSGSGLSPMELELLAGREPPAGALEYLRTHELSPADRAFVLTHELTAAERERLFEREPTAAERAFEAELDEQRGIFEGRKAELLEKYPDMNIAVCCGEIFTGKGAADAIDSAAAAHPDRPIFVYEQGAWCSLVFR